MDALADQERPTLLPTPATLPTTPQQAWVMLAAMALVGAAGGAALWLVVEGLAWTPPYQGQSGIGLLIIPLFAKLVPVAAGAAGVALWWRAERPTLRGALIVGGLTLAAMVAVISSMFVFPMIWQPLWGVATGSATIVGLWLVAGLVLAELVARLTWRGVGVGLAAAVVIGLLQLRLLPLEFELSRTPLSLSCPPVLYMIVSPPSCEPVLHMIVSPLLGLFPFYLPTLEVLVLIAPLLATPSVRPRRHAGWLVAGLLVLVGTLTVGQAITVVLLSVFGRL